MTRFGETLRMIHHPGSREELVELLDKGRGIVAPVGGGVSFAFSVPPGVKELASLRGLGLDYIRLDGGALHIGAMATLARLAASGEVRGFRDGVIAEAAAVVGSTPNRNLITAGGNAVRLFLWSGPPAVYCAAGASFRVRGASGTRTIPADEFFASQPFKVFHHSEYLEEIVVPPPPPRSGAAYERFNETSKTFPLASAVACVSCDDSGRCVSARLVIGNLSLLPAVAPAAGRILEGREPDADLVGKAAAAAAAEEKVARDVRVSDGYKRELAAVLARRALERAFSLARGGGGEASR